jgi:hypothetical protein
VVSDTLWKVMVAREPTADGKYARPLQTERHQQAWVHSKSSQPLPIFLTSWIEIGLFLLSFFQWGATILGYIFFRGQNVKLENHQARI